MGEIAANYANYTNVCVIGVIRGYVPVLNFVPNREVLVHRMPLVIFLAFLLVAAPAGAQEKIDTAMVMKIRAEGLEHSRVMEVFDHLVNVIGPRLTASPAYRTAVNWSRDRLVNMGLDNVHLEPWEFGRGWQLEKLTGSIVMTRPILENFIRADRPPSSGDLRRAATAFQRDGQITAMLGKERPGVTLEPSDGEHGTVFVTGRDGGANSVPSIVLSAEHYNMIARLLEQDIPVKLAVEIQSRFFDQDKNAYNVIAEIKGTDPAIGDEVVMAGAHLDSWHTGTGATDNADGIAVEIEAMRILKTLGVKPRRTIRIALWGGEEQGLLGSAAYVKEHLAGESGKAARDKFSVYFNLDNGTPPITGFYLEGNEEMKPIMEAWLKPLNDLGATISTLGKIGATDHLSFIRGGLPGFQAVQDYNNYDVRTHHTNMDTYERVSADALKQASVVMATVLYDAAMRDAKIPRSPAK